MDKAKVGAILLGGGIGMILTAPLRKKNKEYKEERRVLSESVLRELITMHRASAVMIERIRLGHYEDKTRADVEADKDFELIVQAEAIASHPL